MKKKWVCTTLILISLLLMAFPYGVPMNFGVVNGIITRTFSYYSLIPLGYGIWMPWIVILLSLTTMLLLKLPKEHTKMISFCMVTSVLGQLLSWIIFTVLAQQL